MKLLWLMTREWGKSSNNDKTFPQYSQIWETCDDKHMIIMLDM